jgi:hypothetical protein
MKVTNGQSDYGMHMPMPYLLQDVQQKPSNGSKNVLRWTWMKLQMLEIA